MQRQPTIIATLEELIVTFKKRQEKCSRHRKGFAREDKEELDFTPVSSCGMSHADRQTGSKSLHDFSLQRNLYNGLFKKFCIKI
jgi:hypothetical protein